MNNDDMNNMIKKAQEMIQNNQIPDELKNMVANMQKNSANTNNNYTQSSNYNRNNSSNYSNKQDYNKYSNTYSQRNTYKSNNTASNQSNNSTNNIDLNNISELLKNFQMNSNNSSNNNTNQDFPNIDVETMMRIQNIMSKMKSADSNDDMSKLLISLKPYLRDEKKGKIDEYIKLIRMGKMTQMFESFGGDKK